MKISELSRRVRELELEVARLNGIIDGMKLAQQPTTVPVMMPSSWPVDPLPLPYTRITWQPQPNDTTWREPLWNPTCGGSVYSGLHYQ